MNTCLEQAMFGNSVIYSIKKDDHVGVMEMCMGLGPPSNDMY